MQESQVILAVEITNPADILNCAPVITNAVLDTHQFIVDKIVFVNVGLLAKSRTKDKQRGKVAMAYRLQKL